MPDDAKRPLKVFLCHASADKPKVRELYRYLKRRGLQPWLDAEDLLPGQAWQVEIPKAIETSDAIIICLSKGSVDKEGYVQTEITFALNKALQMPEGRIFLIPARLEECDTPFSLKKYHWVDLFDDGGHEKLMKSLKLRAEQLECSQVAISVPDDDKDELSQLESQALRLELSGKFWDALRIYYTIKRIDPLFPRVDIKINELEKFIRPKPEPIQHTQAAKPSTPPVPSQTYWTRKIKPEYIAAIITAAATIIAGLLSSPLITNLLSVTPAPIVTRTAMISITKVSTAPFTVLPPSETSKPSLTLEKISTLTSTPVRNNIPTTFPTSNIPQTYTLTDGEYPFCIARRFNIDPDELLRVNGLSNGATFSIPMTLKIPTNVNSFPGSRAIKTHPAQYIARVGDTIYSIACQYGDVEPLNIAAVNGLSAPYTLTVGAKIQIP
jgi:LysM repeat protein